MIYFESEKGGHKVLFQGGHLVLTKMFEKQAHPLAYKMNDPQLTTAN